MWRRIYLDWGTYGKRNSMEIDRWLSSLGLTYLVKQPNCMPWWRRGPLWASWAIGSLYSWFCRPVVSHNLTQRLYFSWLCNHTHRHSNIVSVFIFWNILFCVTSLRSTLLVVLAFFSCFCIIWWLGYIYNAFRELIVDSIALIKPTIIMSVPVLFNKVTPSEIFRLLKPLPISNVFLCTRVWMNDWDCPITVYSFHSLCLTVSECM